MHGSGNWNSTFIRKGSRTNLSTISSSSVQASRYESQMNLDTTTSSVAGAAAYVIGHRNLDNINQLLALNILEKVNEEEHLICNQMKQEYQINANRLARRKQLREQLLEILQLCRLRHCFMSLGERKHLKNTDSSKILEQVNQLREALSKVKPQAKIHVEEVKALKDTLGEKYVSHPNIASYCQKIQQLQELIDRNEKSFEKIINSMGSSTISMLEHGLQPFETFDLPT